MAQFTNILFAILTVFLTTQYAIDTDPLTQSHSFTVAINDSAHDSIASALAIPEQRPQRRRLRSQNKCLFQRRSARPRRRQHVKTINFANDMIFSLDVKVNRWPRQHFSNIFHCGNSNHVRQPAIWVNRNGKYLHIVYGTKRNWNKLKNLHRIRLGRTYKIQWRVRRTRYDVYVNGRRWFSVRGTHHNHRNQKCYIGDPWYEAANAQVSNLKIIQGTDPRACDKAKTDYGKYRWKGCYKDTGRRALRKGPHNWRYSIDRCYRTCNSQGFKYFALQAGSWCSCENDWRHATKYGRGGGCPRSHKGAGWRNDIFEIKSHRRRKSLTQSLPLSSFTSNGGFHAHCRDPRKLSRTSWCTKDGNGNRNRKVYLQVNLKSLHRITAVGTLGRSNYGQWVKKYKLQYSTDGRRWTSRGIRNPLSGNRDRHTEVVHKVNFRAQYLRFIPVSYHGWKSMRIEVYGSKEKRKPVRRPKEPPLLRSLPVSAFKSVPGMWPHKDCRDPRMNKNGWCVKNGGNQNRNTYLQVKLKRLSRIKAIGTKGRANANQWVKRYKLQYSTDGRRWTSRGIRNPLRGNEDRNSEVIHRVNIRARYLRFIPVSYQHHKSMRIEAYGKAERRRRRKKRKPSRKRRRKRRRRRRRKRHRFGRWKCSRIRRSDRERKECIRRKLGKGKKNRKRFKGELTRWYRRMRRRGYKGFTGMPSGYRRGYKAGRMAAMKAGGARRGGIGGVRPNVNIGVGIGLNGGLGQLPKITMPKTVSSGGLPKPPRIKLIGLGGSS